jgi:hypothetical protein
MTCYIPYDARENGAKRETACGRYLLPAEHSPAPTCARCREYLQVKAVRDTPTVEQRFGPEPGLLQRATIPAVELVPAPAPTDLVLMIERLVTNRDVDVEKLERVIALQERIVDRNAKAAFVAAFARMQAKLPEMDEQGRILARDGTVQSTYARNEDIQRTLKPILAEFGFGLSFRTEWPDPGTLKVVGMLAHVEGHTRESAFQSTADTSGSKNAIQALGSAVSYGHRYTSKDLLNLTSRRVDDDGQGTASRVGPVAVPRPVPAKVETLRRAEPRPGPAAPAGFDAWWTEMKRHAGFGFDAMQWLWAKTPGPFKAHATKARRAEWEALKRSALVVTPSSKVVGR